MKRKNVLAVILTLMMLICMMPAAFAAGGLNFDPVAALEEQNIWNYVTEFGSMKVVDEINYADGYGGDNEISEESEYYYLPEGGDPDIVYRVVSTWYDGGEAGFVYSFYESYPQSVVYSYVYDGDTMEDDNTADEVDAGAVYESFTNNISGYDLSDARLRYCEVDQGLIVCDFDLGDRDVDLYFDVDSHWLVYTAETGFLDNGAPYQRFQQIMPCDGDVPDFTFRDSIMAEAGVVSPMQERESYEPQTGVNADARLRFDTVDPYGYPVDDSIIRGSNLVIVNFWEPFCSPCCKELPDMEKLYQKYKDAGVLFIGVYGRHEDVTDEEAQEVIEEIGVSYPIIRDCPELEPFENDGWPENYFFDGDGKLLDPNPDGGYKTKEAWEQLILKYLYR